MTTDQRMRTLAELALDGKKYRDRRGKWEKFWGRVLFRIFMVWVDGLILMWGVDAARVFWLHNIPTVGYWGACIIGVFIRSFLPFAKAAKS